MNPKSLLNQSRRSLLSLIFSRTSLILLLLLFNFFLLFSFLLGFFEGLPAYLGSMVVFTTVVLIYILNTDANPSIKLSWCILIGILPIFGTALYFYVQSDLGHRMVKRIVNSSVTESLLHVEKPPEPNNIPNIAHYLKTQAHAQIYENSSVRYFPLGEEAFEEMILQMESAEKYIFLEYFIIEPGQMWNRMLDVLYRKAREGVEIRVLYDGTCAITTLPSNYPKQLECLGIRCKAFAPLRPLVSTHYNYRDHRKILVIDGRTAFTGGINLADEYINARQKYGHWKDTALMIQGQAVQGFTLLFLQMWNYSEKDRSFAPYLSLPEPISGDGIIIPFGCGPSDPEQVGKMVYLNLLNQAKHRISIMTPYLILDGELVTVLRFAALRGVDVRLILPHIPDKKYAFLLAKSHYRELLSAGVKIYEYTPGFVHAKVFLCDDYQAVVGTINLDYRSLYLHYECAAYLYNVPAIDDIRQDFEETITRSEEITLANFKKPHLFTRIITAVLKLLAPLM